MTTIETAEDHETARAGLARRQLWRDVWVRRAIAAGVVWCVVYTILGRLLPPGDNGVRLVVWDFVYAVPIWGAAVMLAVAARANHGRDRRLWIVLAIATTLWATGETTWAIIES